MTPKRVRTGRRPARLCALLGMALFFLGGCSAIDGMVEELPLVGKSAPVPACPKIKVLADAGNLTLYRSGPGRDITDILLEAEIIAIAHGVGEFRRRAFGQPVFFIVLNHADLRG